MRATNKQDHYLLCLTSFRLIFVSRGPDEIERMEKIGNERAPEIYGGTLQRPDNDAADCVWLKYLRDKYEGKVFATQLKQAVVTSTRAMQTGRSFNNSTHLSEQEVYKMTPDKRSCSSVPTADLLHLNCDLPAHFQEETASDFFSQYGL
mmetsp:Transcript_48210/g.89375  ORF Transcript_48210/g.89375 Transcript_48210/m.89375 type:complete len:149 (+) Transcript_48210:423-869(+)